MRVSADSSAGPPHECTEQLDKRAEQPESETASEPEDPDRGDHV